MGVCRERAYIYQHHNWKQKKLIALEVPRRCPLVLLVKLGWKRCTVLGNEEGGVLEVDCWVVQQREGAERLN